MKRTYVTGEAEGAQKCRLKKQWPKLPQNNANQRPRDSDSTNPRQKKDEHYTKNIIIKLLKASSKENI